MCAKKREKKTWRPSARPRSDLPCMPGPDLIHICMYPSTYIGNFRLMCQAGWLAGWLAGCQAICRSCCLMRDVLQILIFVPCYIKSRSLHT